mgnify:CR=1 FL=1
MTRAHFPPAHTVSLFLTCSTQLAGVGECRRAPCTLQLWHRQKLGCRRATCQGTAAVAATHYNLPTSACLQSHACAPLGVSLEGTVRMQIGTKRRGMVGKSGRGKQGSMLMRRARVMDRPLTPPTRACQCCPRRHCPCHRRCSHCTRSSGISILAAARRHCGRSCTLCASALLAGTQQLGSSWQPLRWRRRRADVEPLHLPARARSGAPPGFWKRERGGCSCLLARHA